MPSTTVLPVASLRPSSVSRIDLGCPGRLMTSAPLRTTATCRDRIAVGTNSRLILRICSPKPGMTLSATASVASGVTSRGAGPVPPVVSTRWHFSRSTSSARVASITGRSSGMRRLWVRQGLASARPKKSSRAGIPSSLYTPLEARSLIDTSPMSSSSPAAVMRASIAGSSGCVVLAGGIDDDRAERPEELAIGARWRAGVALRARLARERAQVTHVYPGMRAEELVDRGFVLEQPVAPALDPVLLRGVLCGHAVPDLELLADRRRVDRAHQPADILHLAAARLMLGRPLRELDRLAQVVGQSDRGELLRVEPDQAYAELLELVHFALAL